MHFVAIVAMRLQAPHYGRGEHNVANRTEPDYQVTFHCILIFGKNKRGRVKKQLLGFRKISRFSAKQHILLVGIL
jgi:hypothetical protein